MSVRPVSERAKRAASATRTASTSAANATRAATGRATRAATAGTASAVRTARTAGSTTPEQRIALRRAGKVALATTMASAIAVPLAIEANAQPAADPKAAGGSRVDALAVRAVDVAAAPRLVTLSAEKLQGLRPTRVPGFQLEKPAMETGWTGEAVSWLQAKLGNIAVDGEFGGQTRRAVKGFQNHVGLETSGVVTRETWDLLLDDARAAAVATEVAARREAEAAARAEAERVAAEKRAAEEARSAGASRASRSQAREAAPAEDVAAPADGSRGERVMAVAASLAGIPYKYGGTTTAGFDCSGFTGYVFRKVGVELPRTSKQQHAAATKISRDAAVAGDLVFFSGSGGVYHVGIYAGGGEIWHSPRTGKSVEKVKIWTSSGVSFGRV